MSRTTFNLQLSFSTHPKCPICLRPLRAEAVIVVHGVLFCAPCYEALPIRAHSVAEHLRTNAAARHASWSRGVVAYTPHTPSPMPADELPELLDLPARSHPTAATRPLPRPHTPA